jgi:hypothetical protein
MGRAEHAAATSIRQAAVALLMGSVVALVADAIMQNLLDAARVTGRQLSPWWITGHVMERSTWVAAALLVWLSAAVLAPNPATSGVEAEAPWSRATIFLLVGRGMMALPLVWTLATWMVWAVKITLMDSWDSEGRVFLATSYYRSILLNYFPWFAGGVAVITISRHVPGAPSAAPASLT